MRITSIIFFILSFLQINGQIPEIKQVNMGLLYVDHVYYSFEDGTTAVAHGKTWELGFSVSGKDQGGIFFNEYAERDMRPSIVQGPFEDFSSPNIPTPGDTLRNSEVNWLQGALNQKADADAPFGWGAMTPWGTIVGSKYYILQFPEGVYKKLMIDSLTADGTYSFRFANLDDSNLEHVSFNINDHAGKTMVHFSVKTNKFVDLEPENWDLFFTRLNDLASINGGTPINYNVTSVLTAENTETVEIRNVDPLQCDTIGQLQFLSPDNNIIGHDWKSFDLDLFEWVLDMDRVFFIVLPNDCIWKFHVIDFEGAFSGIITFTQTNFGKVAPVAIAPNNPVFEEFKLFPNPAQDYLNLIFSLKQAQPKVKLQISNMLGQVVYQAETYASAGKNALQFSDFNLPTGNYSVQLYAGNEVVSEKIVIRQ